jgi:hypothetical protein
MDLLRRRIGIRSANNMFRRQVRFGTSVPTFASVTPFMDGTTDRFSMRFAILLCAFITVVSFVGTAGPATIWLDVRLRFVFIRTIGFQVTHFTAMKASVACGDFSGTAFKLFTDAF